MIAEESCWLDNEFILALNECSFLFESTVYSETCARLFASIIDWPSLYRKVVLSYPFRLTLFDVYYAIGGDLQTLLIVLKDEYLKLEPDALFYYFFKSNMDVELFDWICQLFHAAIPRISAKAAWRSYEYYSDQPNILIRLKRLFIHYHLAQYPYLIETIQVQQQPSINNCCICLEGTTSYTECRHALCLKCMHNLRETSELCPICRRNVDVIFKPKHSRVVFMD